MQRPLLAPLALALCSAALLLLAINSVSKNQQSELMSVYQLGNGVQLFDLDPNELGASIYSTGAEMARNNLEASMDAAEAARKAEQQRMYDRMVKAQQETDARMIDSCSKDPSLPGCPWSPQAVVINNLGLDSAKEGAMYYNAMATQSKNNLEAARAAEKAHEREMAYKTDVARYEKEMAYVARMKASCANDPSLPGCPTINEYVVTPAQYPYESDESDLKYAMEANDSRKRLGTGVAAGKAWIAMQNEKVKKHLAEEAEAYKERMAVSCAMDPSLPGCPW